MKKITLFMALIMSCTLLQVNAQVEITQAEGTFVACTDFQDGDIYTDGGGSAADYPNSEETTMIFQAPAGAMMSLGAWMGTIMLFNVWVLIWPNQKKVLGIVEASADDVAKAKFTAAMASRTNVVLSVPMLLCMIGAGHGGYLF